ECLEQAIALDPGYALAYSELGFYFATMAGFGMLPAHKAVPLARAAVQKALDIDPLLPDALATLGRIAAVYDYDWKEAERLFHLAMARHAVQPGVRQLCAFYLLAMGGLTGAIEELEHALREDPLNPYSRAILAFCYLTAGREADAAKECRRILELDD